MGVKRGWKGVAGGEWDLTELRFQFDLHFQLLEFEVEEMEKGERERGNTDSR
jgi:hypothetical protein